MGRNLAYNRRLSVRCCGGLRTRPRRAYRRYERAWLYIAAVRRLRIAGDPPLQPLRPLQGQTYGTRKATVYPPDEFKAALERSARAAGCSDAVHISNFDRTIPSREHTKSAAKEAHFCTEL